MQEQKTRTPRWRGARQAAGSCLRGRLLVLLLLLLLLLLLIATATFIYSNVRNGQQYGAVDSISGEGGKEDGCDEGGG